MGYELTGPVHGRGRRWAVTGYGVEALDGRYHVPAADIWPATAVPPEWARDLYHRSGVDRDDLDAALDVARSVFARPAALP